MLLIFKLKQHLCDTHMTKCSDLFEKESDVDEMPKHYSVRYLPLFWDDLNKTVGYIAHTLQNPDAAERLVNQVETKILEYLEHPEIATKYRSSKPRARQYYWFAVGNYMVFYVLEGNVMEVRRFLFGSRDLSKMPL